MNRPAQSVLTIFARVGYAAREIVFALLGALAPWPRRERSQAIDSKDALLTSFTNH
jgi:hypothetical protein